MTEQNQNVSGTTGNSNMPQPVRRGVWSPVKIPNWLRRTGYGALIVLVVLILLKSCGKVATQSYVAPEMPGFSLSSSYYTLPTPLRTIADNGGAHPRLDSTWPTRHQWLLPSGLVLAYTETSEEYKPVTASGDADVLAAAIATASKQCMAGRFILIDPASGLIKQFTNTQLAATIDASIVPLSDKEVLVIGREPRWDQCYTGLPPTPDFDNSEQTLSQWQVYRYNYFTDTATKVAFTSNLGQGKRYDYIPTLPAATAPFVVNMGRKGVLISTEYSDGGERKPVQYVYSPTINRLRLLRKPINVPTTQLSSKALTMPGGKTLIYRADGGAKLALLTHSGLRVKELGPINPSIGAEGVWYQLNPSQVLIADSSLGTAGGGLEPSDRVMLYDLKQDKLYYRAAGLKDFVSPYQLVPIEGNRALIAGMNYADLPDNAAVLNLTTWQFEKLDSNEDSFATADLPAYNLDLGGSNIAEALSIGLNNWLFVSRPQTGSGRNQAPTEEITTFSFYQHAQPGLDGLVNTAELTKNGWREASSSNE